MFLDIFKNFSRENHWEKAQQKHDLVSLAVASLSFTLEHTCDQGMLGNDLSASSFFPLKPNRCWSGYLSSTRFPFPLGPFLLSSRVYCLLLFPHRFTLHALNHFFDISKSHNCVTSSHFMVIFFLAFVPVEYSWFSFNLTNTGGHHCDPLDILPPLAFREIIGLEHTHVLPWSITMIFLMWGPYPGMHDHGPMPSMIVFHSLHDRAPSRFMQTN